MKQIAISADMYAQDYDECYPMSIYPTPSGAFTLYHAMLPYIVDILTCPSEKQRMSFTEFQNTFGIPCCSGIQYFAYNGNYCIFEDGPNNALTGASDAVVSKGQLPFPSETFIMGDGEVSNTFNSPVVAAHNEGFNAAFADGHAKWVKVREASSGAQYTDLGGNLHYPCYISGGAYNGCWELWGVVRQNHSIGAL